MRDDDLIQRLMATFFEELDDHVRTLNEHGLALEKEPPGTIPTERLDALLRAAHSLKGAARAVGVRPIEDVCHRLEEQLLQVRQSGEASGPEMCSSVLAAADQIQAAGRRLRADPNGSGEEPAVDAAMAAGGADTGERPASAPAPAAAPRPAPSVAAPVRVPAARLDRLLAHSGELRAAASQVEARLEDASALLDFVRRWRSDWRRAQHSLQAVVEGRSGARLPRSAARTAKAVGENLRRLDDELERLVLSMGGDRRSLGQAGGPLEDDVRRVRMLPFAEVCEGLERAVRDLAQAQQKEVAVVIEGGTVELDRSVLEAMRDPLRHLARNAVDHGIEPPAERRGAGKPPCARLTVAAALRGAQVEVTVSDDGRGLDVAGIRAEASRRELPVPDDERQLADVVFTPGFSTAARVTHVSGRGVGLDVVKRQVESVHGTVDVESAGRRGTRFTLRVPLTLTALHALLVAAAGQVFALLSTHVRELRLVGPNDLRQVQGRTVLSIRGDLVPVVGLADTLGLEGAKPSERTAKSPVVLLAAGDRCVAFGVDELLAEQEIVVKALGTRLRPVPAVAGATVLATGRIALVLSAGHLVRRALEAPGAARPATPAAVAPGARRRVLLVDDSITTRSLEKSVLEAAGYEVVVAPDGEVAWRLLQQQGADALVSDVDMPRMDGIALTETVRASERFRGLPIMLVTGRESEADKVRGMQAGADAYLVKSAFDQQAFLDALAQLL